MNREARFFIQMLMVGLVLALPGTAWAAVQCADGQACCMDDRDPFNGLNCTANDLTFVLVGLGIQDDGCVNPNDTFDIWLRAVMENTTSQTRYDVGFWVATDGDPNGDGALTGSCVREQLANPSGVLDSISCTDLNLTCGFNPDAGGTLGDPSGPLYDADLDGCADIFEGAPDCGRLDGFTFNDDGNDCTLTDGLEDETVMDFRAPATGINCTDADGSGFVDLAVCASYGNEADQVGQITSGQNRACSNEDDLHPGTKAKCQCEPAFESTVPAPNLALSCSCSPNPVDPGGTTTCTVSYTNSLPNLMGAACATAANKLERFRCGTASFLRYRVDYDETQGQVTSFTSTRGTIQDQDTDSDTINDTLLWTPASVAGTSGVIAANETDTLSFDYQVDADTPQFTTINMTTTSFWSNTPSFSQEVAQTALTCSLEVTTTPVTIAAVSGRPQGSGATIEWSTATETGNLGFHVYEISGRQVRRLNDELIPSRVGDTFEVQDYSLEAPRFRGRVFAIEDVATDGKTTLHGPFTLGEDYGQRPDPRPIDWATLRLAESRSRMKAATPGGASFDPEVGLRLEVPRDGLYRLRYEDLAAAGFDFRGTPVQQLALTTGGEPVALRVEGSGAFGPGDRVEFFAETVDTLYTGRGVYLLRKDRTAVLPATPEDGATSAQPATFSMHTADFERDRGYNFASPTGDPWFDTRMLAGQSPQAWTFPFDLDGLTTGNEPSVLEVDLWGVTRFPVNPDHHVVVSVNGLTVADEVFDGLAGHVIRAELPPGLLALTGNTLRVELPGDTGADFDLIHFDGFRVTHPRRTQATDGALLAQAPGDALRVTNLPSDQVVAWRTGPGAGSRIENVSVEPDGGAWSATFATVPGATYAVATASAVGTPGVEAARSGDGLSEGPGRYLVISHPLFLDSLAPLVTARESQGWGVKVVDVEDVYGRYGHGYRDPAAIRDYVAWAAANLGTEAVLLVGGDTYDYRDFLGRGSVSFLPTLYATTSDSIHFAPADPLIGDVDDDGVPDLQVGRFPARSVAELDTLIAKTLAYESKTYGRTAVFAADRRDAANSLDFSQESERFLTRLTGSWNVDRAYIDALGVAGARQQLNRSIEDGTALTSFVGHSGPTVWSFSNLFNTGDAEALGNTGKPTLVVQWGCWNAYHVEPRFDTLGHDFLLSGDRGAAAVLGSTTLLSTSSARLLSEELAPLLAEPGRTVGSAVLEAKRRLAETRPELRDVLIGWTLLGDPGLVVEP